MFRPSRIRLRSWVVFTTELCFERYSLQLLRCLGKMCPHPPRRRRVCVLRGRHLWQPHTEPLGRNAGRFSDRCVLVLRPMVPVHASRCAKPTAIPVPDMTEHRTVSLATFAEAFVLDGADGVQPPGTYLIEAVEEPLDSVSFLGFRRVSTTITLPAVDTATLSRQVVAISPTELASGSICHIPSSPWLR